MPRMFGRWGGKSTPPQAVCLANKPAVTCFNPSLRSVTYPTLFTPQDQGILSWHDIKSIHPAPSLFLSHATRQWKTAVVKKWLAVSLGFFIMEQQFIIDYNKQDPIFLPVLTSVNRAHWTHATKELSPSNIILRQIFSAMWAISVREFEVFQIIQLLVHVQPAVGAYTVTTGSFKFSYYRWLMQLLLNFYN